MTLTKKCKHCFEHRLLKRNRVWLNKGINISTEPGRKGNINKDSINRLLLASGRLISSFQENCALYAFFIFVSNPRSSASPHDAVSVSETNAE